LLEEADRKAESLEKEGFQNGGGNGNINQGNVNGVVRRRPVPRTQDVNNKNVPNLSKNCGHTFMLFSITNSSFYI
jgi:hypothetical protein